MKSTRLEGIDIVAMRNGRQLTRPERLGLIRKITEQEVWDALQGIEDTKAPGIDGYNARFFKAARPMIKKDVLEAIYDFF